jgi:hypothetical protein
MRLTGEQLRNKIRRMNGGGVTLWGTRWVWCHAVEGNWSPESAFIYYVNVQFT